MFDATESDAICITVNIVTVFVSMFINIMAFLE